MLMTLPKIDVQIRPGIPSDIEFIDVLQKKYNKNLGFLQTQALAGKIELNQVLIAETDGERVGYIIAADRYFKRDEIGYVTQLVVAPNQQRGFIGAALLKAQFDRSAYGCRLYCCWCAQDLEANRFWESMGFVPLAFRNGSEKKGKDGKPRVHIFWEKKIRGNEDACHWWFPAKTDQGAMRADRIVFPIPPGVHWSEVKAIEIPREERLAMNVESQKPRRSSHSTHRSDAKPMRRVLRALSFEIPEIEQTKTEPKKKSPRVKTTRVKQKIDPKFIAAARELRDRWLEQVNEHGYSLESNGKYDISRQIDGNCQAERAGIRLLAA